MSRIMSKPVFVGCEWRYRPDWSAPLLSTLGHIKNKFVSGNRSEILGEAHIYFFGLFFSGINNFMHFERHYAFKNA